MSQVPSPKVMTEPDLAFLEYLGMWDESDEDWLLLEEEAPTEDEDDDESSVESEAAAEEER